MKSGSFLFISYRIVNEQVNLILGVIQSVKFGQKLLEERRGLFNEHTDDYRRIVFRLCNNKKFN